MSEEFARMIEVAQLTGADRDNFLRKVEERHNLYQKKWTNTSKGEKLASLQQQLADAKTARDTKKIETLTPQVEELKKEENKIRAELRPMVVTAMPLAGQKAWAGNELYRRALRDLGRAKLTDDQKARVRQMADEDAAKFVKEGTLAKDPYLLTLDEDVRPKLVKRVTEKVLTAEQRSAIEQAPAAKPAPKVPAK